jgi:hypothetical protein
MRRARHHTFQKPGWWLGRMTLRVVTAWSDLSIVDWESRTSPVRILTPPVTRWGRRVVSNHALLSLRTATRRTPAGMPAPFGDRRFLRSAGVGSRAPAVVAPQPSQSPALAALRRRGALFVVRLSFWGAALSRGPCRDHRAEDPPTALRPRGLPRWLVAPWFSGTFRSPSLDPRRLGMARPPPGLREVEGAGARSAPIF